MDVNVERKIYKAIKSLRHANLYGEKLGHLIDHPRASSSTISLYLNLNGHNYSRYQVSKVLKKHEYKILNN